MNKFTFKVGYLIVEEEEADNFYKEVIENNLTPYELVFEEARQKVIKVPCQADCGDVTCDDDLWGNLDVYYFESEEKEIPLNLIKAFNALIMFDPVVAVQVTNPLDPTDTYFWNRFDDDEEEIKVEKEQLN